MCTDMQPKVRWCSHISKMHTTPIDSAQSASSLDFLGTVRAVNVILDAHKALVSQRKGASFTVETVVMPRLFFIGNDVGSFSEPCDRVVASRTLLGYTGFVAIHTVEQVFHGSEALSSKLLLASGTHEALRVPWSILVIDPSRCDRILALDT